MTDASNDPQNGSGLCPDQGRAILVVEDNPQAAKLLSLYLSQAGYRVTIAGSGAQALALAGRCRPTAITLDLLLPDMDGWDVLAQLKATPGTQDVPVVIISVLDRQSLGFELGASDYLVKPVGRSELLRALERCMPRDEGVCRKVMVVHTDLDKLNLLAMVVAQESYEVVLALGADKAAWLAKHVHPDLVVTDLLAGGMDCYALLEGLRAEPETAHVPVLALTTGIGHPEGSGEGGDIEFVLVRDNELIEERLLATITRLFKRGKLVADGKNNGRTT